MKKKTSIILFSLLTTIIFSCTSYKTNHVNKSLDNINVLDESPITIIPLEGEISARESEISGLCWYGDKLIVLPQYPNDFGANLGKIFYISRNRLERFFSGSDTSKITPDYFSINLEGFENLFKAGSGFEAATILNDTIFFSIENINYGETESIIVRGEINNISKKITLDKNSLVKDPINLAIHNISDESILHYNNMIIPIYEVYGKNLNKNPKVSIFNKKLEFQKKLSFPNIEYRITDVTSVDENGKFWAMNYFYPGDNKKLNPAKDILIEKFGMGKSHIDQNPVERLVEFQILDDKITFLEQAPLYLRLIDGTSRNWEGIARFNNGFLIATDTFPETILAFVSKK